MRSASTADHAAARWSHRHLRPSANSHGTDTNTARHCAGAHGHPNADAAAEADAAIDAAVADCVAAS